MTYYGQGSTLTLKFEKGEKEVIKIKGTPGTEPFLPDDLYLDELPTDMLGEYYGSKYPFFGIKLCSLIDPCNSLAGCQFEEEYEKENVEAFDQDDRYEVVYLMQPSLIRKCWCPFIHGIMKNGWADTCFHTTKSPDVSYNIDYIAKVTGERINSETRNKDYVLVSLIIQLESDYNIPKKVDVVDLTYYDEKADKCFKIKTYQKYGVSNLKMNITLNSFPSQFILRTKDITLRTTGLVDCCSRKLRVKYRCASIKDFKCYCDCLNQLRVSKKFTVEIPLRVVSVTGTMYAYRANQEFWVKIEGAIDEKDSSKINVKMTFDIKYTYANSYNSAYNHGYENAY